MAKKTIRVYDDVLVFTINPKKRLKELKIVADIFLTVPFWELRWEDIGILLVNSEYSEQVLDITSNYYDVIEESYDGNYNENYGENYSEQEPNKPEQPNKRQNPPNDPKNDWQTLEDLVDLEDKKSFYYILAKRYHPDHGDKTDKMSKINQLFSNMGVT